MRSEACIFGPKFNTLKKYECALKSEFTLKSESNYYAVKPVILGHKMNSLLNDSLFNPKMRRFFNVFFTQNTDCTMGRYKYIRGSQGVVKG